MKRAIILDADKRFVSALVSQDAEPVITVGMRTCCLREMDFRPYSVVAAGSTGRVILSDPDTGEVEILLDHDYPGLRSWGNSLVLMPFESDDVMDGFKAFQNYNICHAA